MKLGMCYMVFDGEELLEYAIKPIRKHVDFVSVTYQNISYFGNQATPDLLLKLKQLRDQGLIDRLIYFETDLSVHHKVNEQNLRNIGLKASRDAGCTHHISSDVDEFYKSEEFKYAKDNTKDYDCTFVPISLYFKEPTFLVTPDPDIFVTFIHPVDNEYNQEINGLLFKKIERTRRVERYENHRIFTRQEITQHHMSYVRKDIRKKFANNDNKYYYRVKKLCEQHDKYVLGERVQLIPEFRNRRTRLVNNTFGIQL